MSSGECTKPENSDKVDFFFSDNADEKYEAKNLCFKCDVRKECVVWALETNTIWYVWGGKDENELRRILSVNAEGNEIRRGRFPQCPYCSARTSRLKVKIVDRPDGGRWTKAKVVECLECHTEWQSRSSANAVIAYHTERATEAAKKAKDHAEKLGKSLREAMEERAIAVDLQDQAQERWDIQTQFRLTEDELTLEKNLLKEANKRARLAVAAVERKTKKTQDALDAYEKAVERARSRPMQAWT